MRGHPWACLGFNLMPPHLGHWIAVVEPQPKGGQGPWNAMDPVISRQGRKLQDELVYLGADAVGAGDLSERLGGLCAQRGRAVVDKGAH